MSDEALPGTLTARNRDLGRDVGRWISMVILAILCAIPILALFNVFGQRTSRTTVAAPPATLSVTAPHQLRGGLVFQARFVVRAHKDLKNPEIVLGPNWFDGITINTIEPQPSNEASRNGNIVLSYDQLSAGQVLSVFVESQVNPTRFGRHDQTVELDDNQTPIARMRWRQTIFP